MKALSLRISSVHLVAMLLALQTSLALHAGPGPGDPGRPQHASLQEASSSSESESESESESGPDLQGHAHEDPHNHASLAAPITAPEGGWASDAPLRQGMRAILDAVIAAVRDGGEAKVLATELRAQISYLFANCKLEPQADAALHGILAELLQSAQRLEAGASPTEEHDALHASLQRYGQQFQHPDWPLR